MATRDYDAGDRRWCVQFSFCCLAQQSGPFTRDEALDAAAIVSERPGCVDVRLVPTVPDREDAH